MLTITNDFSWPGPDILLDDLNGSFMRNENRFPDSGRCRAALHEAVHDPNRTIRIGLRMLPAGAESPGETLTHWKTPRYHGAHPKLIVRARI